MASTFKKMAMIGAAAVAFAAAPAAADVITFNLDQTVEGTTPSGFPTATFTDAGANTVTLQLDLAGLSGGEFSSGFFFNFAGDADGLSFTRTGGTGPSSGFSIQTGSNEFDTPGNQGLFDIFFEFSTSNSNGGAVRFNADEFLTFSIMGDGLTASLFDVTSAPQQGNSNFALARIQGIAGGASASVADGDGGGGGGNEEPVPEPAALGLFGLGLLALSVGRRRRKV